MVMEDAKEIFSEMMGEPSILLKHPMRVTSATVARVKEARAEERFAAEREELEAAAREQEAVVAELAEECVAKDSEMREKESALTAAQERIAALEQQLATVQPSAEQQAAAATAAQRIAELEQQLAAAEQRITDEAAHHEDEMRQLAAQLEEAQRTSLSSSVLLDKPDEADEVFFGELRHHVVDALREALTSAEATGRERRAHLLEAVIAANLDDAEMQKTREQTHRLLVDGDGPDWKSFEQLGFKHAFIRGRHVLTWAGIEMPLDTIPSEALRRVL